MFKVATAGTLFTLCLIALIAFRAKLSTRVAAWKSVLVGITIAAAAVVCSIFFRRWVFSKRASLGGQVSNLLLTAESAESLSSTLALQVDNLLEKCKLVDEKILGMTIAVMVKEYGAATQSDDRQKALMNAVTVLEKLMVRLSPWYVRHEKLIATAVSVVGIISGIAAAIASVAKVVQGK
jgi:hypothetical protein